MSHCPKQGVPDTLQCPNCGCTKHYLRDFRTKVLYCIDCEICYIPIFGVELPSLEDMKELIILLKSNHKQQLQENKN